MMEHKCHTCGEPLVKRTTNFDFFSSVALIFSDDLPIDEFVSWECRNPECPEHLIEKKIQREMRHKHRTQKKGKEHE